MAYRDRELSKHNQRIWNIYRRFMQIENRSPETVQTYFQALYNADNFFQADLTTLTKLDLMDYFGARLETMAASSVLTYYISLRAFYNWLVTEDIVPASPMKGIPQPTVPDRPPRVVPDEELKALLAACQGKTLRDRRDEAIIRVMSEPGGPRRAEIADLLVDSIDGQRELIRLHGKGDKVRWIPYGAKTALSLQRYMTLRAKHRCADSPKLWLGLHGPITKVAIGQMLESRCVKAGIPRIHPHQLRHTSADRWFGSDGSENDAMYLFGWVSRDMPARYGRENKVRRAQEAARRRSLGDRL